MSGEADSLQTLSATTLPSAECAPYWADFRPVTKNMACINTGKAAVCVSGRGGPVISGATGELIGSICWGESCRSDTARPHVVSDPARGALFKVPSC